MVTAVYSKGADEWKLVTFSFTAVVYEENSQRNFLSRKTRKAGGCFACRPFALKGEPAIQSVTLHNGVKMPMLGYGALQMTDRAPCEQCVSDALACGYRLIDTAAANGNERAIGAAVKKSGIARREMFIITKLWIQDAGYGSARKAFETSLKNLGLNYIDLYLIHQPFGDYYGAWQAMERLYAQAAVRAIGVSNFSPERLVDLCMNQEIRPMVNQIEIHPFYQQREALQVMAAYGVMPQAWAPYRRLRRHLSKQNAGHNRGKTPKNHRAGDPALARSAGNPHHSQNRP